MKHLPPRMFASVVPVRLRLHLCDFAHMCNVCNNLGAKKGVDTGGIFGDHCGAGIANRLLHSIFEGRTANAAPSSLGKRMAKNLEL